MKIRGQWRGTSCLCLNITTESVPEGQTDGAFTSAFSLTSDELSSADFSAANLLLMFHSRSDKNAHARA